MIKSHNQFNLRSSKSYNNLFKTLVSFDKLFLKKFDEETIKFNLEINSTGNLIQEIISKIKVINQTIVLWEKKLDNFYVLDKNEIYENFVAEQLLNKAVNDTKLTGDTFFTQFRGLHQIPEILASEINDHIDFVIQNLDQNNLEKAIDLLYTINLLTKPIIESLNPLINYLSTYDYHKIRENLGLTSGSHSNSIHTNLLNQKYRTLANKIIEFIEKNVDSSESNHNYLINHLKTNVFELRIFINNWRDNHINLPRNNLGGDFTKSLIGSSDAIEAVKKMQSIFREKDALSKWLNVEDTSESLFTKYVNDKSSLDYVLLRCTGQVTKYKFKDVQNREGIFRSK